MKVLKNNFNKVDTIDNTVKTNPYPRKFICEKCGSELEYEKVDLRIGAFGCAYLDCPLCGCDNPIDDDENCLKLTVNNVEFPTHYWHTSKESGAVDICDNKHVKEYLNKAIDYFRKNKDEFAWTGESGNLAVHVFRYSGDKNYYVTVSNNYYSTFIKFEDEDYE